MSKKYQHARKLREIDWDDWRAVHPATLVFVVRDAQVLLIRKRTGLGQGKINGPGGKIEPGETPRQGAIRECQEELLITPHALEYCGQNRFQFVDGYSIHVWTYRTDGFDGVPTQTEEATPMWFDLQSIPYDEMWADDRLWLPMMLRREHFMGRYIFDGDTMLDHHIETGPESVPAALTENVHE